MSESSSDSFDGPDFVYERTNGDNFQQRLIQAQLGNEETEPLNNNSIKFMDFYANDDTEELKKQLMLLQTQVEHMEARVKSTETKLNERREKRNKEAGLTNMTSEERAEHFKQEEERRVICKNKKDAELAKRKVQELKKMQLYDKDEEMDIDVEIGKDEEEPVDMEEPPDWDVIFEYMLLLSNTSDEYDSDLLGPQIELRKKAFEHEDVLRQTTYSSIRLTEAKNTLEHNLLEDSDTRHCELAGYSFEQKFHVSVDVTEPSMAISKFDFEVDIGMQLDVGDILQRVKEECDIMGFFRLTAHYATLDIQRKQTFKKLIDQYQNTPVNVETLSLKKLQFEGHASHGIKLLFSWKMVPYNLGKEKLDANIENHVHPELTLESIALSEVIEKDVDRALDQINDSFQVMIGKFYHPFAIHPFAWHL